MARAQFDREQVVKKSTELFWQQGFSGSSMQQICQVTDLKPGSLYLAFGSKEGLYQAALEYYAKQSRQSVIHALDNAPSVGQGICRILIQMVKESGNSDYCSCFMIKSQLELKAQGSNLQPLVGHYMKAMEDLYINYLGREYAQHRVGQYATSLMLQIYGLRIYGYRGRSSETMLDALKSGLPWLPWQACGD